MPTGPVSDLLTATTPTALAAARARLGEPDPAAREVIAAVMQNWDDARAVSNVLMYPDLLAPASRVPTLIRGLEDIGYPQVAAAVGCARLPAPVDEDDRIALVDALLDLIAGQGGPAAQLAAAALPGVVRSVDAAEIVVLLAHPDDAVRHQLQAAVVELVGGPGLDALLDDRTQVRPEDAADARAELAADGIDLTAPTLPVLSDPVYLPAFDEFVD